MSRDLSRDTLGAVELRQRAIKRAEGNMTCFACNLEYQTARESQRAPAPIVNQRRLDTDR
jgi:hypothetical protein